MPLHIGMNDIFQIQVMLHIYALYFTNVLRANSYVTHDMCTIYKIEGSLIETGIVVQQSNQNSVTNNY